MHGEPLVITSDKALLGELERVAAAAGVGLEHVDDVESAVTWRRAPLVVLDADQIGAAIAARLPRRDGVICVATRDLDAAQWECCLALGVQQVLGPDAADHCLVQLLADTAVEPEGAGAGGGLSIAVVGACGGAGATVFAVATAVAAQRSGRQVVLADADPWGPGVDVVLGLEESDGVRWCDIAAPSGRLAADVLHRALPAVRVGRGRISVLCHSRHGDRDIDPSLLDTVVDSVGRAGDFMVIDLPRAPCQAADRAVQRADLTVLVVPADVRACYGAARVVPRLVDLGTQVGLVVRGPSPGGLGARDIADALELPLLAGMRPEPGLDRRLDSGSPPGCRPHSPLGRAAAAVLSSVGVPS